jgi:hypothetical protein
VQRNVAASTQNQALAALLFLYRGVLRRELGWFDGLVRAKRPVRLPVVLTQGEVTALLAQLKGAHWLTASLLYGACQRQRTEKPTRPLERSSNLPARHSSFLTPLASPILLRRDYSEVFDQSKLNPGVRV